MKEKDFISIIKQTLNSEYIGDDCAYLKELGIVVTQDSLVEGVHFSLDYFTPYQLGFKSVAVNISDIAASGAKPKYLTISLSLPENTKDDFIKEFYKGAKAACGGICEIVGGDITGADKVFVSVCAIGSAKNRFISSRKNAKNGYKVVAAGEHGSSGTGLKLLQKGIFTPSEIINKHLMPAPQIAFGEIIGKNVKEPYAMTDTSDGLLDALVTIAKESDTGLEIDFDKIPVNPLIKNYENWQDAVLFGGEDYGLIAVIPEKYDYGAVIGKVVKTPGITMMMNGKTIHYDQSDIEQKTFNHFKK